MRHDNLAITLRMVGWARRAVYMALGLLLIPTGILASASPGAATNEPATPSSRPVTSAYLDTLKYSVPGPKGVDVTCWRDGELPIVEGNPESARVICETTTLAQVARTYLELYARWRNPHALADAREAVKTLLALQKADGSFATGLLEGGRLWMRGNGPEQDDSTGWAFWALCRARNVLPDSGGDLSQALAWSEEAALVYLESSLARPGHEFGTTFTIHGYQQPAWLLGGGGDTTAPAVLGLCEAYRREPSDRVAALIEHYVAGMTALQQGDAESFPFQAFIPRSNHPTQWYPGENRQGQALAEASRALNRPEWLKAARREAMSMTAHLITSYGPVEGFYPAPQVYPQSPLEVNCLVEGLMSLYRATGLDDFAVMGGIFASWLWGNNLADRPIYQPDSGRVYGDLDAGGLRHRDSAAYTAAALLTHLAITGSPAELMIAYRTRYRQSFQILDVQDAVPYAGSLEIVQHPAGEIEGLRGGDLLKVERDTVFWFRFNVNERDDYKYFMIYVRQPMYGMANALKMRVDGYKIFQLPLGGSQDLPYLVMDRLPESFVLTEGFHSLGVRYSGLNFSNPALLSCVLVQPEVEKILLSNGKTNLLFCHSMTAEAVKTGLPLLEKIPANVECTGYDSIGNPGKQTSLEVETVRHRGFIPVAPYGVTIVRWTEP